MQNITLYRDRMPFKALSITKVTVGASLLFFYTHAYLNDIYYGTTIFGFLLGIALFINGLSASSIKLIGINFDKQRLEIQKTALFKDSNIKIDLDRLNFELKQNASKSNYMITRIRLIYMDADKEVCEMKSNVLATNNPDITKVYQNTKQALKAQKETY